MDTITRHPGTRRRSNPAGRTAVEIQAAIELVASGAAVTVRLSGLPGAARLAATAAEQTRAAGLGFGVERDPSGVVLSIGPEMPG